MYDILPDILPNIKNNVCILTFQVMFNAFIITNVLYFALNTIYNIILNIEYFIYGAIFSFVFITEYSQINREYLFKQLIDNTFISTIRNKANSLISLYSSFKSSWVSLIDYICRKSKFSYDNDDSDEEPLVNKPSEVVSKTTYLPSGVEIKDDESESVSESEGKEDVSESKVEEDVPEVVANEPVSEVVVEEPVPEVPISKLIKDSEKYFKYIMKPVIDTNTDMD
jgi:hypothetical protein